MSIPVYSAEAKDGLTELILSNNTLAFDMEMSETKDSNIIQLGKTIALDLDNKQHDLFYIDSVLVSVGWNRNDDVFDPAITWAARNSPIDKPFNLGHDEDDIIGHMTASFVQSGGKVIPDDTPDEKIPDVFDIVVSSVIYSKKQNPESQTKVTELIDGIKNNDWCVSMECLFRDFDFALIGPDGTQRVIARDESTAHLTRYLRIFGGEGVYNGNKVGRLLKNFAFSGKGLVERPANPRSVIINNFHGSQASLEEIEEAQASDEQILNQEKEDIAMSDVLQKQLDSALARVNELEAGRDEAHAAVVAEKDEKIVSLTKAVDANQAKIVDLESQIEAKIAEADEAAKAHETAVAEKDAAIKTLEDEKAAQAAALVAEARKNQLIQVGEDKEVAAAQVDKFSGLDDEAFATIVELTQAKFPDFMKKGDDKKDDDKDDKKDGKKKDDKKGKADVNDDGEDNADADVLDGDVDDKGTPETSTASDTEELLSACASYFAEECLKYTPVKENK